MTSGGTVPSQLYRYKKKHFATFFFCKNKPCARCGTHECHNPNWVLPGVDGWMILLNYDANTL